jgi:hypothetical protein
MAEGRLLRLHVAKLSHGKRPAAPIWLQRRGFTFEHLRPTATDPETVQRERLRTLWRFVRDQAAQGIRHTGRTLEDRRTDLGMTRDAIRAALHVALERRHLLELELPAGERRGGRQNHLSIGTMP